MADDIAYELLRVPHAHPGRGRAGSDQLGVERYRYGIGEVIVFGISLLTGGSG